MPRRGFLETNEIYHIINRGVARQPIYKGKCDYQRFIEGMQVFNTNECVTIEKQGLDRFPEPPKGGSGNLPGNRLVDIICYTLLPNHFHLLLRQVVDGGINKFMRKLGSGYANYFNTKYNRVGPLYQGRFLSKEIKEESHLLQITRYIHLNVLDLSFPEWREGRVSDWPKALYNLKNYKWSSCSHYLGCKKLNYIKNDIGYEFIQNHVKYKVFLRELCQT